MTTTIGPGDFVLVRRPLLPLAMFEHWRASPDAAQFVIDQYRAPLLEEGLYIASPALHARLEQLRNADPLLAGTERRNSLVSLTKFLSRAAYRCTPFGTFAHVQLAAVGNAPPSSPARALRRGIHLDAGVEARLVELALDSRDWRETLSWQINSTAYLAGANLAYIDWIYEDGGRRNYRAVELAANDGLRLLRQRCQHPLPFERLCGLVQSELDVSDEEARGFLHDVIDRRLLAPRLAATAGSGCSLDVVLAAGGPHPATATLRTVRDHLHALRSLAASPASLAPGYQALQGVVEAQLDASHLKHGAIQVDSIDDTPATVDADTAARIADVARHLAAHTARARNSLADYKRQFRERFEDREVNFAYALHAELGVPFPAKAPLGSALLDGLKLGAPAGAEDSAPLLNAFDRLLVECLFEGAARGEAGIVISAADLAQLPVPATEPALAEGLYAHVSVLPSPAGSAPAIELHAVDGRSGLETLARFCHLSAGLEQACQRYHAGSARGDDDCGDDAIYAEIVHHPQDRLRNILRRPRLHTHDIVFAGASELPRERQLWLEDLTVQLAGERFVLRERRSGRTVIPRLTSAHNYSGNQLGPYQFLCCLQDDDAPWIGFHWPHAVRDLPRLPRVEVAGVIVARAQWVLRKADIEALNGALNGALHGAPADAALDAWRSRLRLPRFVTFDQGDNRLPVDLANPASAMLLLDEIIKLPGATVQECLPLNLADEHGCFERHNQEWMMPLRLTRPDAAPIQSTRPRRALRHDQQRDQQHDQQRDQDSELRREGHVCPALDEWVYLRIYTGSGYADQVLREAVLPVMEAAREHGDIDRWFFIRYRDQFEHLRLRFHGASHDRLLATLAAVEAQLDQARNGGLLWRVVKDHYIPERDRYGGPDALVLCERLFCVDSEDLRVLLDIEAGLEEGEAPARWLFALASLDAYARRLCPEPEARERMLATLAALFLEEQAPGAARSQALVALGARFREMRRQIEGLGQESGPLALWRAHLHKSGAQRDALIDALRSRLKHDGQAPVDDVWQSLLHMHCNRLVPSEPRRHETVLYDFARRLERARQAKGGQA